MTTTLSGSLTGIVAGDPLLRLHCRFGHRVPALRPDVFPVPAAVARFGHRVSTAVVRPVALVARILFDRYGLVVPLRRLAIELPGATAGIARVILPECGAIPADEAIAVTELSRLAEWTRSIGDAAADASGLDRNDVAAGVRRAWRAEWRHCGPAAAALLDGNRAVAAHAVSPRQHAILTAVIDRVAEAARRRRREPGLRRPAVLLDVDFCALVPHERTRIALRAVADRFGIAEFRSPEALSLLPTYHRPTWRSYCAETGVRGGRPSADPEAVHAAFSTAFFNPWNRMLTDEPAVGLRRFMWDVYDAGGEVVFNTGRQERVRKYTEPALARAGAVRPRMVMAPNGRARPIADHKVENLRAFADLDIVAVFDDLVDNRRALAKELANAMVVAVAPRGFATEPPIDGAEPITDFERIPRTARACDLRKAEGLSDSGSLAELDIRELGDNAAATVAVHLDAASSRHLVSTMIANSDRAAVRLGDNAVAALPGADHVALVHHVLTRSRFRKGSTGNHPLAEFRADVRRFIECGKPIPAVLLGFPAKMHYNGLKTSGVRPDLSEIGFLVRLRELQVAVRAVYEPGLRITVLTDGDRFEPRPRALLRGYHDKLAEYHRMVGGTDFLELVDMSEMAGTVLGRRVVASRHARIDAELARFGELLTGLDVREGPYSTLDEAGRRCATQAGLRGDGTPVPDFVNLFRSLMYSVPLEPPAGVARPDWARLVYADLFHLSDPDVTAAVRRGRADVLAAAWRRTIRYIAVLRVDRQIGYDDTALVPGRIKLTVIPRPGSFGFAGLGGAGLLPWHATGAVDPRGRLGTDFAVTLADRGYAPIFSELLDDVQPWFMAPSTRVSNGRLDPAMLNGIRLRHR